MEQLDLMIKEVNEREVKDDEILSDHAYLYDVKEKRFYFYAGKKTLQICLLCYNIQVMHLWLSG